MKSPRALAIILALSGATLGCGDGGSRMVSGEELRDAATVSFPTDDGVPPLGEVKAVLFPPGDTVVVVNASEPFLHLYSRDGSFLGAAGAEGGGPNELEKPWRVVLHDDTLYILDGLQLVSWSLHPPGELERTMVLNGTVGILSGCGGRLTAVYMGTSRESGERVFGIRVRDGSGWQDVSDLGPLDSPLVLSPSDYLPMHRAGRVLLVHYGAHRLERHDCRTGEVEVTPLPIPESWVAHFTRGTVEAGGRILTLAGARNHADTTRLVVVRGDSVTAVVDIQGDFRLHAGPDSLLALVDYTPVPVVRLYHRDTLLRVLAR